MHPANRGRSVWASDAKENTSSQNPLRGRADGAVSLQSPRKIKPREGYELDACAGLCARVHQRVQEADIFADGTAAFANTKVSSRMTVRALPNSLDCPRTLRIFCEYFH